MNNQRITPHGDKLVVADQPDWRGIRLTLFAGVWTVQWKQAP